MQTINSSSANFLKSFTDDHYQNWLRPNFVFRAVHDVPKTAQFNCPRSVKTLITGQTNTSQVLEYHKKIEQIRSRGVQNDQKYFPEKDVYTRCQEDIEGHLISKDQTIQFNSIQPLKEIKLFPLWIHGRGPFQDFLKDFEIFSIMPYFGRVWVRVLCKSLKQSR